MDRTTPDQTEDQTKDQRLDQRPEQRPVRQTDQRPEQIKRAQSKAEWFQCAFRFAARPGLWILGWSKTQEKILKNCPKNKYGNKVPKGLPQDPPN